MARVSIIIPTHNRAHMLGAAIESAKRAGDDVEVIVVDDASTDETMSMCQELQGIVFIRLDRNAGLSQARNTGILRSTGEFVAFLDDDDLRIAGSVDKQADVLARNDKLGFVYGQVHIGDAEHCRPTGVIWPVDCPTGDIFWEILKANFIYVPSVLVPKRRLESVGLFDPSIDTTQDWDLWLRLAEANPVEAVKEPVAIYRYYTPSSKQMSSNRPRMCKSVSRTLVKAFNTSRVREADPGIRQEVRTAHMDAIWHNLITEGRTALSQRRFLYAAANYITAIQLNPRRALRPAAVTNFLRDLMR